MNPQELHYLGTGRSFREAVESQMFGKPCFKINGKAFICFFNDCMVFKLKGEAHAKAIALPGAALFDPSGKGRAMKKWVQVPFRHQGEWQHLAQAAYDYVHAG